MASYNEPDLDEYDFNRINQEVENIESLVIQFCGLQGRSSQDIRHASQKLERIRQRGQSTLSRINSLKVKMNDEIQCLGHQRDQSYQAGMANLGRTGTQAQRLAENWSDLSPMMQASEGMNAVVNAMRATKDYQTSCHLQDFLNDQRNKLLEVKRQQDKLQDLLDQAEDAYVEMQYEMR